MPRVTPPMATVRAGATRCGTAGAAVSTGAALAQRLGSGKWGAGWRVSSSTCGSTISLHVDGAAAAAAGTTNAAARVLPTVVDWRHAAAALGERGGLWRRAADRSLFTASCSTLTLAAPTAATVDASCMLRTAIDVAPNRSVPVCWIPSVPQHSTRSGDTCRCSSTDTGLPPSPAATLRNGQSPAAFGCSRHHCQQNEGSDTGI